MKKSLFLGLAVLVMLGAVSCSSKTVSDDANQLPATVKKEVKANFKTDVSKVVIEKNSVGADEYDVYLSDGAVVKYEGNEWEEVKAAMGQSVPEGYVIKPISEYVTKNQTGAKIVKIERDKKGYEVKLSNGVEIKFDTNGNFVKLD